MSNIKIRNIAKYGIINDLDPYDLPPEAFSNGVNVRFRNGRVTRAPVFRAARDLGASNPRFVFASNPTTGLDQLFVGYKSGRVYLTTPTSETDYSITSYADVSSEGAWSSVHLADVTYVNREDRTPWFLRTSDAAFQDLSVSGWDSTWRTRLLRACGGALVALNVTKAGVNYPTMVKTSGFPTSGSVPASWDQTVPATNATENILAELEGSIVDAESFGNNLVIYGINQAWLMQKVTGFENFDYYKLPFQKGAISANCAIEIDGRHYVFGPDDIWMHDGTSEVSICDGTNRDFIFSSLNMSKSSRCFVTYNATLHELYFCYPAGDSLVSFPNGGGCNKQAVYNLLSKTWTFDDLPLVYASARASLDSTVTYATATQSYATVGGTYQDQDGSLKRTQVYVGENNTEYALSTRLYAFDQYGQGSTVAFAVDTNATKGLYLERDGIDLDQLPDVDLEGYKRISTIYPLCRVDVNSSPPVTFTFGSSDYYGAPPVFDTPSMDYDGLGESKLDYNIAGRYFSLRVSFPDYKYVSISGFDLDASVDGER